MRHSLSKKDVEALLADRSPVGRTTMAAKVAYALDRQTLTPAERRYAEEIIGLLARDAEVTVRQALAAYVKEHAQLPRDVAVTLAQDVESVALPVLRYSAVLTDEDLIAIVRGGAAAKQTAIARRTKVSSPLSDALIDHGDEAVVATLFGNDGADIAEASFDKVITKFPASETVQAPLMRRARLPLTIVERLYSTVSETFRGQLLARRELPPNTVGDLVLHSREKALLGRAADASPEEIERLVQHLQANKRLTPSIVLRALCMGDLTFFEASLAVRTGLTMNNVRLLVHDDGKLGLQSIYAKADLPQDLYPAVRTAIDIARETQFDGAPHDRERYCRRMIERILTQYADVGEDTTEYLIGKLSRLQQDAA
ncbi:MAG: DUF2336 domain-containing protein [Proteobacteria bacterium]|nr:DUF2336 domain-containing protein [Pseudomonadota bacterium]